MKVELKGNKMFHALRSVVLSASSRVASSLTKKPIVGEDDKTKPGEVVWVGGYNVPYIWKMNCRSRIKK